MVENELHLKLLNMFSPGNKSRIPFLCYTRIQKQDTFRVLHFGLLACHRDIDLNKCPNKNSPGTCSSAEAEQTQSFPLLQDALHLHSQNLHREVSAYLFHSWPRWTQYGINQSIRGTKQCSECKGNQNPQHFRGIGELKPS